LFKLQNEKVFPNAATQKQISILNSPILTKPLTFEELLRRNEISFLDLESFGFILDKDPLIFEPVEIEVKYAGYVRRQYDLILQAKKFEELLLPLNLNFSLIKGLSNEEVEKLTKIRPRTLGQAQRISGVNPSATQAILIYLKGRQKPLTAKITTI
jgi:tRNA uridine 5-carboxymethylaminomethyl modification enzyme